MCAKGTDQLEFTDAQGLLLTMFILPRDAAAICGSGWSEVWANALREQPRAVLDRFHSLGVTEHADMREAIGATSSVEDLRRICRANGISAAGKKEDLINNVLRDLSPSIVNQIPAGAEILQCSKVGMPIAIRIKADNDAKREACEELCLRAVSERRFLDAAKAMVTFEAEQPLPRGLGINWSAVDPEENVSHLEALFGESERPHRERYNIAAAMSALWGNTKGSWLKKLAQQNLSEAEIADSPERNKLLWISRRADDKPAFVNGRHFTTYVSEMYLLKLESREPELEQLLLCLISATDEESKLTGYPAPPAYQRELDILRRKRERRDFGAADPLS